MVESPVIIGGSGGSGTRVVAQILQNAGIYIGNSLNKSSDALEFVDFYDRWINTSLKKGVLEGAKYDEFSTIAKEFDKYLSFFIRKKKSGTHWGWKNPRSMYMLPFFKEYFGEVKFIHVVRDGRDMVYSKNQNQYNKHGISLLGVDALEREEIVARMEFWSRTNLAVSVYAEKNLRKKYHIIKFEDLCSNPQKTLKILAEFLALPEDIIKKESGQIIVPKTIGRWKEYAKSDIDKITEAGRRALSKFEYKNR